MRQRGRRAPLTQDHVEPPRALLQAVRQANDDARPHRGLGPAQVPRRDRVALDLPRQRPVTDGTNARFVAVQHNAVELVVAGSVWIHNADAFGAHLTRMLLSLLWCVAQCRRSMPCHAGRYDFSHVLERARRARDTIRRGMCEARRRDDTTANSRRLEVVKLGNQPLDLGAAGRAGETGMRALAAPQARHYRARRRHSRDAGTGPAPGRGGPGRAGAPPGRPGTKRRKGPSAAARPWRWPAPTSGSPPCGIGRRRAPAAGTCRGT